MPALLFVIESLRYTAGLKARFPRKATTIQQGSKGRI